MIKISQMTVDHVVVPFLFMNMFVTYNTVQRYGDNIDDKQEKAQDRDVRFHDGKGKHWTQLSMMNIYTQRFHQILSFRLNMIWDLFLQTFNNRDDDDHPLQVQLLFRHGLPSLASRYQPLSVTPSTVW